MSEPAGGPVSASPAAHKQQNNGMSGHKRTPIGQENVAGASIFHKSAQTSRG